MSAITIFVKDYVGLVADISELMGKSAINILSIHAEQMGDNAIISLETDDMEKSLKLLNENQFPAMGRECVLIKLPDQPGELGRVSRSIADAGVEIRGINMIENKDGVNLIAIISSDDDKIRNLLQDKVVK